MTTWSRVERELPDRMADLASEHRPDYLDDAFFGQMADIRQRPSWAFPERWLPVDISTRSVPAPRLPWRQLGVLAVIAILVAATLAIYVGSQQQRLPAPFGPAGNGDVAYAADGDIYVGDPSTGDSHAIVTGPELDVGPRWSRDGTHIAFERKGPNGSVFSELYVVAADGSDLTLVTPERVQLTPSINGEPWARYEFSPDGRSVLIASIIGGTDRLSIADSDGSGVRTLDVGRATEPSFRPPGGKEVLFVADAGFAGDPYDGHAIMSVDLATGAVRTIVADAPGYDLAGASWSPDGESIAYWQWGGPNSDDAITAKVHIVSADGTGDRVLPMPPDAQWQAPATWSNDGTKLVVVRGYGPLFEDVRPAVVPTDGSSTGVDIPYEGVFNGECCTSLHWAPDDSEVLITPVGPDGQPLQQVFIDVVTGAQRPAPWTSTSDPAWQRIAQP